MCGSLGNFLGAVSEVMALSEDDEACRHDESFAHETIGNARASGENAQDSLTEVRLSYNRLPTQSFSDETRVHLPGVSATGSGGKFQWVKGGVFHDDFSVPMDQVRSRQDYLAMVWIPFQLKL